MPLMPLNIQPLPFLDALEEAEKRVDPGLGENEFSLFHSRKNSEGEVHVGWYPPSEHALVRLDETRAHFMFTLKPHLGNPYIGQMRGH